MLLHFQRIGTNQGSGLGGLGCLAIPNSGPYPQAVDHYNHLKIAKPVRKLIG